MSLLESIQNKKQLLKYTQTRVTRSDGRQFIEDSTQEVEIQSSSYGFVVDTKPDTTPSKIEKCIYLGSQDCCDPEVLQKYEISSVLSVGIQPAYKVQNVTYLFVPCLDLPETNIVEILVKDCMPFMNRCVESNLNLLVHCNAGVSRSSAVIIGYLMLTKNYDYTFA